MKKQRETNEKLEESPLTPLFEDIGILIAGNQTTKDGKTLREVKPDKYMPKTLFGHFVDGVVSRAIHDAKVKHGMEYESEEDK
ncbi:hypothetical protein SAMN05444392_102316 [Seinonella peptonophila]|uniref:Uncharacterized protein n=1 Tax=Seinonella peptonophila TaxID=112248 RepID=A0A1M4VDY9_9BACL|nr:hypothetical protein [Seinonella peptonophila]SHE67209.1 hypothetical protein SAMN05444392_102316 [Seinonella peptonophila]